MAIDHDQSLRQVEPIIDIGALEQRLSNTRIRLADAARLAGRSPEEITLVGVSKFFPAEYAIAANQLGLEDLGENRVQELLAKTERLNQEGLHPNWHLIGTLQKNKVRQIIGRTHLIHSVESVSLLEEISRRSQQAEQVTDVLLQVNTAREETKHGFSIEDLPQAADVALGLAGVRLRGLMTMAPLYEDPERTLPIFDHTRKLFDHMRDLAGSNNHITVLSMGMSLDFAQAIRCGATHVRIGTAIFGPRL